MTTMKYVWQHFGKRGTLATCNAVIGRVSKASNILRKLILCIHTYIFTKVFMSWHWILQVLYNVLNI